jgi:hypothetical protein
MAKEGVTVRQAEEHLHAAQGALDEAAQILLELTQGREPGALLSAVDEIGELVARLALLRNRLLSLG